MVFIDDVTTKYTRLRRKGKTYWESLKEKTRPPVLENSGYCPTCTRKVTFVSREPWLRDNYFCSNCGSIPRERALMVAIEKWFPNWPELVIHESSPRGSGG